jgi:hypothetical protein
MSNTCSCNRYDSVAVGPVPIRYASSAILACKHSGPSATLYSATVGIPKSRQVRITRQAISPRLAIKTLSNGRVVLVVRDADDDDDDDDTIGVEESDLCAVTSAVGIHRREVRVDGTHLNLPIGEATIRSSIAIVPACPTLFFQQTVYSCQTLDEGDKGRCVVNR